jgi:aryl-alcohol dehydrogenase (NADP+)
VVRAGKALYVGASSMYAWQFVDMLRLAERHGFARFVTMQNHYNLIYREEEREMIPFCRKEGIGLLPWSPLARGYLTRLPPAEGFGETSRGRTDEYARRLYLRPGMQRSRRRRRKSPGGGACPWPGSPSRGSSGGPG